MESSYCGLCSLCHICWLVLRYSDVGDLDVLVCTVDTGDASRYTLCNPCILSLNTSGWIPLSLTCTSARSEPPEGLTNAQFQ